MLAALPFFWQATLFTGAAVLLVGGSAGWLFLSPLRGERVTPQAPSTRTALILGGLLGLSALQLVVGGLWDASQHLTTGEIPGGSDFLWPSHLVIYSSFLVSLSVALIAMAGVIIPARRAGMRDPREWARRSPELAAVALASLYQLMAIPGDALWHELFGIDLTAWSPPHLSLALMGGVVLLSAASMIVRAWGGRERPRLADALILALPAMMLNVVYMVGVLEWELPGPRSPLVNARPIWSYPVVAGTLGLVVLLLARELVARRWAATATAAIFLGVRGGVSGVLGLTGNIAPALPLFSLGGALLLDLLPWRRWLSRAPSVRHALEPLAYSLGFAAGAIPVLAGGAFTPVLRAGDLFAAFGLTFALGALLSPLVQWVGRRLRGPAASAIPTGTP
jgi:hypothetical protein